MTTSGPWFELCLNITELPMTAALARELNRSIPLTVGHLLCLWSVARWKRPSGDLTGISCLEIENWAQWAGSPGHFSTALGRVGYLLRIDGEIILCDERGRPHPDLCPKPMERENQEKGEY